MDEDLQRYSFHATWNLEYKLAKPFNILMTQIKRHIKDETHDTFKEEGLLFKSYLLMSGIGGKVNKDKQKAIDCLKEVIGLLEIWNKSPNKDGFLAVAYALEAWIDMDKTERRLENLHQIYVNNRHETRKPFEATIHYIKGYSLSRLGGNRYAESISEFRQAAENCPDNYEYLFSLALMRRRFYGPDEEIKTILHKVLTINKDYLYAKVELANLICDEGNVSKTSELLKEVTTIIEASRPITPENMKILGHVMKIYLKINQEKADEKVKEIYEMASQLGNCTSFVAHQRASLAKKTKAWSEYRVYLEKAVELNPFNLQAKIELTKHKAKKPGFNSVFQKYEEFLSEHEDDQLGVVKILFGYGEALLGSGNEEKAILRFEKAMYKAIQFGQHNPGETSTRVKFIPEIAFAVTICFLKLNKYYQRKIQEPEIITKHIELHFNLRNVYLARSFCKRALHMRLDDKPKHKISCILAEVQINLSTDMDSLAEVDSMLKTIKPLAKDENELKNVEELEVDLCYKKSVLQERKALNICTYLGGIGKQTMLEGYCNAAISGHKGAIMRLFSALEVMDERNSTFYETCAYLKISVAKFGRSVEEDRMQKRLRNVLETAISGDLKRLRNQQLEMEEASINQTSDVVSKLDTVIQTSRNMLNSVMNTLEKRYRNPKPTGWQNTIDFFCIQRNFDRSQTEVKVRAYLKKHKWAEVDKELINFLVEIQPCTNPKVNNWIMAFMEFNNTSKHQRQAKEYDTYKVYPEDQGTAAYRDKEYCSLQLARTVCNNIPYILDNLNGFSPRFQPN